MTVMAEIDYTTKIKYGKHFSFPEKKFREHWYAVNNPWDRHVQSLDCIPWFSTNAKDFDNERICQEYGKFLVDECSLRPKKEVQRIENQITKQPETIKERPETIVVPVSVMGDVSNIRRQILQNTLDDELKEHFRLIPQDRFEEVQEKVFEELEYEECTEDQCIKMIQEMLQVENMFHLQVIGEEGDTQLTLKWVNLDEKRVEEDFCEDCKTRELRKMIGGLVERLIGKK